MLFLYALTDQSEEYFWFHVISTCELNLYSFFMCTQFAQLDLFGVIFPRWIQQTLETMSAQPDLSGESGCYVSKLRPSTAFRIYSQLTQLVSNFNAIFGNLLVGIKFAFIIAISFLIYALVRHPVNLAMTLAHLILALTIPTKLTPLLMSMGGVHRESLNFKSSWIHALGNNFESNKNGGRQTSLEIAPLFHYVPPISFCGGPFYDIQASTILTFISITTTYIIVVLQF